MQSELAVDGVVHHAGAEAKHFGNGHAKQSAEERREQNVAFGPQAAFWRPAGNAADTVEKGHGRQPCQRASDEYEGHDLDQGEGDRFNGEDHGAPEEMLSRGGGSDGRDGDGRDGAPGIVTQDCFVGEHHACQGGVEARRDGSGDPAAKERVCAHTGAAELGYKGPDRRPEMDQGSILTHGGATPGGEECGEGGAKAGLHIQRISALVRRQN